MAIRPRNPLPEITVFFVVDLYLFKCTLNPETYGERGVMEMEISVKEARSRFSSLLDKVEEGGEVIIRRRGKEVPA